MSQGEKLQTGTDTKWAAKETFCSTGDGQNRLRCLEIEDSSDREKALGHAKSFDAVWGFEFPSHKPMDLTYDDGQGGTRHSF